LKCGLEDTFIKIVEDLGKLETPKSDVYTCKHASVYSVEFSCCNSLMAW
jgi:hypothetical protein